MAKTTIRIHGGKPDILVNKAKSALIKRDIHLGTGKIPAVGYEVLKALAEEFGTDSINVTITKETNSIVVSKKGARTSNGCIILTEAPMNLTSKEIDVRPTE